LPSFKYRDGKLVELPDVVVSKSGDLHEDVKQTLVIKTGVTLTVHGSVSGTVEVQPGATLKAQGDVSGTVHVATDAEATLLGRVSGTLKVSRGGVATLAPSAVALGTMSIDGTLINHGTRGVQVHGAGVVDDREGSTVRQPDETWEDGTEVYYC
jgi:hypothetical protein